MVLTSWDESEEELKDRLTELDAADSFWFGFLGVLDSSMKARPAILYVCPCSSGCRLVFLGLGGTVGAAFFGAV